MDDGKKDIMTARKQTGRWQEFADSKGIDAKYAEEELEAQRQLIEATAGPGRDNARACVTGPVGNTVRPGDTDMKNPHGSYAIPSPNMSRHPKHSDAGPDGQSNRTPGRVTDAGGQQGGAIKAR